MADQRKNVICAGAVVFRMNENGGIDFLLIRHAKDKEDKWGIPKGHLEAEESIEECAVREVYEESGGVVARLLYELPPVFTANRKEFKTVHFFLATQLNPQQRIKINPEEIAESKWFPMNKTPKLHHYQKPIIRFARNIINRHM